MCNHPDSKHDSLRIIVHKGHLSIDGYGLAYSNINNMYTTGDGHCLQLNEENELKREELTKLCNNIADAVYKFHKKWELYNNSNNSNNSNT